MARRHGCAMPSHLVASEDSVIPIPDKMTLSEAATFPTALLTSINCLLEAARPTAHDVLLVHTASGGVGLMCIQVAHHIGCTIVVTAGNDRKRNYLRSLGLKYVFNSRNTEYAREIREALNGRGVTIVLNSLTGAGYKEATLGLCEKGARFIEMSKMNIWTDHKVKQLRPDIHYQVVDVSAIPEPIVQDQLNKYLSGGTGYQFKPLPYTQFRATEIREALEYMEKVKHIGKIVVTMPEQGDHPIKSQRFSLFNDRSTYLITGGLGGLGLEVAKWMVSFGARSILLIGRSPPKKESMNKIADLQREDIKLVIEICDIGNLKEAEGLFVRAAATMLPIRGIFHAAGVIEDGTWENQSWEKYQKVFRGKVDGAWNLHELSLSLSYPLEHFVLFSSITSILGSLGQSNYVAANQYLDSLAHYRHAQGQPATSINWGPWAEVGMAANKSLASFKPLEIHQGLAALEHALRSHRVQVAAYDADLEPWRQVLTSTRGLLSEIGQYQSTSTSEADSDKLWADYDAVHDNGERIKVINTFLKKILRITLKMDKNEQIGDYTNFDDMGMDSLLMVEMKNRLQAAFGKRLKISMNNVKDCKNVTELSTLWVELISGKEELPPPTRGELKDLIYRDINLPPSIKVDDKLITTLVPLSQVECVLLLGVTGTLGSYMLLDLLKQQSVKKIVCLLKHNPVEIRTPRERFMKLMSDKKLIDQIALEKIDFVTGDIREPNLGLDSTIHARLVNEVHAVINVAAKVCFEEIYRETEDPRSSRVTNVFGMRNILEFAVKGQLKYIFHASSIVSEIRLGANNRLWENWVNEEILDVLPNSAYLISKLICDRMVEKAVTLGVPCKIFRFPQIGGHSLNGENCQVYSFMMMRFVSYMYLGIMPAINVPLSILPVDICSRISIQLFFDPNTEYEVFNLLNPHPCDEREFDDLAEEFGVTVEAVEPEEFVERVENMKQNEDLEADMLQLIQFGLSYKAEIFSFYTDEIPSYMSWIRGNKNIYWSEKLERLMPSEYPDVFPNSWDVLRQDIQYIKDIGMFDRYKIKYNPNN